MIKRAHAQGNSNNNFVAPRKGYEYHMDLFFIKDLDEQNHEQGFLMIDVFTKFATVIPVEGNKTQHLLDAIKNV